MTVPFRVVQGDARVLLQTVEPGSVQCIVSSPPYNVGIDYGAGGKDLLPWPEYRAMALDVATGCHRAMADRGRLWWNVAPVIAGGEGSAGDHSGFTSNRRTCLLEIWLSAFTQAGLELQEIIVWVKMRGGQTSWGSWQSPSAPNMRGCWESILVLHKGGWQRETPEQYRTLKEGLPDWEAFTKNVWRLNAAVRDGHPAPFPVELAQRAIRLSTWPGELVLDPFCGSGTTLLAAKRIGRPALGFDLSPEYCELAMRRLGDDSPLLDQASFR